MTCVSLSSKKKDIRTIILLFHSFGFFLCVFGFRLDIFSNSAFRFDGTSAISRLKNKKRNVSTSLFRSQRRSLEYLRQQKCIQSNRSVLLVLFEMCWRNSFLIHLLFFNTFLRQMHYGMGLSISFAFHSILSLVFTVSNGDLHSILRRACIFCTENNRGKGKR